MLAIRVHTDVSSCPGHHVINCGPASEWPHWLISKNHSDIQGHLIRAFF